MIDLGRRLLHDPKSREYAYSGTVSHVNVRHAMNAPHVDQFYLSGCVGFSGINLLNTTKASASRLQFNRKVPIGHAGLSYLGNDDGIRSYHEATVRDPFPGEYPPVDEGSSALGLMKWWLSLGVVKGYDWAYSFTAFLAALSKQPVLIGTNWYDDMMSTGSDGIVRSNATGEAGGHEYVGTEIRWDKRLIGCEQSWGENPPEFGKAGRFWIPFDLAEELIIHQQGDVAVPRLL